MVLALLVVMRVGLYSDGDGRAVNSGLCINSQLSIALPFPSPLSLMNSPPFPKISGGIGVDKRGIGPLLFCFPHIALQCIMVVAGEG